MQKLAFALLAFVISSPAYAHHCGGSHANDPGCSAGQVGTLVLVDALQNVIGIVSSMSFDKVKVYVEHPVGNNYVIDVSSIGFFPNTDVFFTAAGCGGMRTYSQKN